MAPRPRSERIGISQTSQTIPIGLAPVTGTNARRLGVASINRGGFPDDWRIVLGPLILTEPTPGDVLDFTSGLPNRPAAIVRWGTDGTFQTAEFDWPSGGGQLSVWADVVTVEVSIPNTWITAGPGLSSVAAQASIVPGAVDGGPRQTRTKYSGLVAGAGAFSGLVAIPAFARAMRWHQMINLAAGGVAAPITWFGVMNAAASVATQTTPNGVYTSSERTWPGPDGLTLTPDTRFVMFQNNAPGAGDSVSMALEFVLDI